MKAVHACLMVHNYLSSRLSALLCLPDYTHVVFIGSNELIRVAQAFGRYSIGGEGYVDPVAFDKVFEVNATTGFPVFDESGLPVLTFTPMVEVRIDVLYHLTRRLLEGIGLDLGGTVVVVVVVLLLSCHGGRYRRHSLLVHRHTPRQFRPSWLAKKHENNLPYIYAGMLCPCER